MVRSKTTFFEEHPEAASRAAAAIAEVLRSNFESALGKHALSAATETKLAALSEAEVPVEVYPVLYFGWGATFMSRFRALSPEQNSDCSS